MENERRRTTVDGGEQEFEKGFGRRLRTLRTSRGWSQEHLAGLLTQSGTPIHQTQVAKIEAGARPVKLAEAVSLARLLSVDLERLATGPLPGESRHRGIPKESSARERNILQRLESLVQERQMAQMRLDVAKADEDQAEMVLSRAREVTAVARHELVRLEDLGARLEKELIKAQRSRNLRRRMTGDQDAPEA